MIRLAMTQLWVHDQDDALAFYTERLGFEVRTDVTMPEFGDFRWLEIALPGQDVGIVLMAVAGPPMMDEATKAQVEDLMAKGLTGTVFLQTEDCHADYELLRTRGVEFVEEPTEQPYGIDASFRDPSGNHLRLTQVKAMTAPGT